MRSASTAAALGLALLLAPAARADLPGETITLPARVGDVTFTHKAHFKRAREGCRTCHGPGRAQKIEGFLLANAHRLCLGCHREQAAGPTGCRGCHQPRPAPPEAGPG